MQMGIVLQVGSDPAVPIALKVGAVSERVSVEANASQVETSNVGVGSVIENQRVLDLPLNGRQPTDLIALGGAAVQTAAPAELRHDDRHQDRPWPGACRTGVQYNLDGAPHINFFDGTSMLLPFPDALQEFKIATSTQDASSCRALRSHRERRDEVRHERLPRRCVSSSSATTDVNARDFFAEGIGRPEAQPVRRRDRRPHQERQAVLLRGLSGHICAPDAGRKRDHRSRRRTCCKADFTAFESPSCPGGGKTLKAPFGTERLCHEYSTRRYSARRL